MEMKKSTKITVAVIGIILFILLLSPIKLEYDDGGTVEYRAILYSVQDVHRFRFDSVTEYEDGTIIKILGIEIFNNVK